MGVGMPQDLLLHEFGSHLWYIFDEIPYHVGSSLENKHGWRDVDVRVMLDDIKWEFYGFGPTELVHNNGKWVSYCLALSQFGRHLTGLPIDFQIQKTVDANREFKCRRSALGFTPLRHNHRGDTRGMDWFEYCKGYEI